MTQQELIDLIKQERYLQDEKFGNMPRHRNPSVYLPVLMEEVGEVAKAVLEKDAQGYPMELIQVAAVCLAALEDFYQGKSLYNLDDVCGVTKR